jgi:hypothetical protein
MEESTVNISTQIDAQSLTVTTRGAETIGQPNLRAQVTHVDLLQPAAWLLESLLGLARAGHLRIEPGAAFTQGYWLCKFGPGRDGEYLDVWEVHPSGAGYRPVVDLTVQYWVLQSAVCEKNGAEFRPAHLGLEAQIAEDVLHAEGPVEIEGIRFPANAPDSGWVFIRVGQAGKSPLRTERLHTITGALPDLIPFLALPHGYRFAAVGGQPRVWFDPEIANHVLREEEPH